MITKVEKGRREEELGELRERSLYRGRINWDGVMRASERASAGKVLQPEASIYVRVCSRHSNDFVYN